MEFREEFTLNLREALNHLSDPKRLLSSPLVGLFNLSNRSDKVMTLQNILIDGIKALQPPNDISTSSKTWRQYESLYYRYIEGLSQQEVAEQLNLGVRHLQREQTGALEVLADYLIRQLNLHEKSDFEFEDMATYHPDNLIAAEESELAWLKEKPIGSPLNVAKALTSVFETASTISKNYKVRLDLDVLENLPDLAVHPVVFNEIILNLVTLAVTLEENGSCTVKASSDSNQVRIEIYRARNKRGMKEFPNQKILMVNMAERLINLSGGKLNLTQTTSSFMAKILLPAFNRLKLLVVDDNSDTLQLFMRYSSNTQYQIIPCQDALKVFEAVEAQNPDVILIDVMMPQIDGWLLLSRLRHHPLTGELPIIICTILPQEELAYSLGATSYLKKPVTRQQFLAGLNAVSFREKKLR